MNFKKIFLLKYYTQKSRIEPSVKISFHTEISSFDRTIIYIIENHSLVKNEDYL